MNPAKRILVNSMVQYVRTFLSMAIMLLSTRLLINTLGHSDYGLYSVVGSMVFMIGFITASLSSSTQRFLSYSHGTNDMNVLGRIFANAFYLHLAIASVIAIIMWLCGSTFIGNLSINSDRYDTAAFVYMMVLLMTLTTFLTAPVRALYIARENIIYVSVVEVIDALFKLVGAVSLQYISFDSLRTYSVIMFLISVFNLMAYLLYALKHYEECHIPRPSEVSLSTIKSLSGFAVWNVYAVGSGVARMQGLAIVINRFLGTLVNAAYGIALQVYNAVSFIALSILNSMNPQLMKAEGSGDRQRMLLLTTKESKYSFLLLALVLIPLICEMPSVLSFWLDNVPAHSAMFCQAILASHIWDQTTIGLTSANQAIGKVRNYSLVTSTIRLAVLPVAWYCLSTGMSPYSIMVAYIAIDVIIGVVRVPFLKATGGLQIWSYCKDVYLRTSIPVAGVIATSIILTSTADYKFRFVVTEMAAIIVGLVLTYLFALTDGERLWIKQRINKKK